MNVLGTCGWLTTTPPDDINFKGALKQADYATLERALDYLTGRPKTKTARDAIAREMRRRMREDRKDGQNTPQTQP